MSEIGRDLIDWLKKLPNRSRTGISRAIEQQANRLAAAQRAEFNRLQKPPEETGGGLQSIRVERKSDLHYDVKAGGDLTTKDGYDHMLAFEFGTRHQPARPFFYSTARALNKSMRDAIENAAGAAVAGAED